MAENRIKEKKKIADWNKRELITRKCLVNSVIHEAQECTVHISIPYYNKKTHVPTFNKYSIKNIQKCWCNFVFQKSLNKLASNTKYFL